MHVNGLGKLFFATCAAWTVAKLAQRTMTDHNRRGEPEPTIQPQYTPQYVQQYAPVQSQYVESSDEDEEGEDLFATDEEREAMQELEEALREESIRRRGY